MSDEPNDLSTDIARAAADASISPFPGKPAIKAPKGDIPAAYGWTREKMLAMMTATIKEKRGIRVLGGRF